MTIIKVKKRERKGGERRGRGRGGRKRVERRGRGGRKRVESKPQLFIT